MQLTEYARTRDPIPPGARVDLTWRVGDTWCSDAWAVLVDDAPVQLDAPEWTVTGEVLRGDTVVHSWAGRDDPAGVVLIGSAEIDRGDGAAVTTSTVALTHNSAQSRAAGAFTRLRVRVRVATGADAWTVLWGSATALPERLR